VIDNNSIRRSIREKRCALSKNFCLETAKVILEKVISTDIYKNSTNIAIYLPHENEGDTWGIIHDAWSKQKNCYTPHLDPEHPHQLCFILMKENDARKKDPLGMHNSTYHKEKIIPISKLDLSITPLVVFDENCYRMGRGKGFYDHTFSYKLNHPEQKPFLLGLAYELQKHDFTQHALDVPLQRVITEKMIYDRPLFSP
jgi:5-formyltetrahydrofolate cyclo-ligase